MGANLGLDADVQWFGLGGLRWHSLPFFYFLKSLTCGPHLIATHLFNN